MPIIAHGPFDIDVIDRGAGPPVALIHSSVSGNRQWSKLMTALEPRYRLVAPNLFGYGRTTPWPANRRQTIDDQVDLLLAAIGPQHAPLHIVGHSFGGTVALRLAHRLGRNAASLTLLEANPFQWLDASGRATDAADAYAVRDHMKACGARGDFAAAAPVFCDYWVGAGAWAAMPDDRRAAFIDALAPNYHEWDTLNPYPLALADLADISASTLVLTAADTVHAIHAVADVMLTARPDWHKASVASGGHMAPLIRPDLVNPLIIDFIDRATGYEA